MKLKILAVFIACITQCSVMRAESVYGTIVNLYYRHTPKLDGNMKPSKAPANFHLTLNVSLSADSHQLIMQDSFNEVYTYYIYNENEDVVAQGVLDFGSSDIFIVDLWNYPCGPYVLVVVHNGYTFCGSFEID